MADLVVLGFKDMDTAAAVAQVAQQLQKEELLDLEDAAIVVRQPDGKVKIHQSLNLTGVGAASGAVWGGLWGLLLGLLFLNPLLGWATGLVLGGGLGALTGKLSDIGIDDDFIKQVGATLQPGTSAIFALVRKATPDRVAEALRPYNPTVIRTSLSKDNEAELVKTLAGATTTSAS